MKEVNPIDLTFPDGVKNLIALLEFIEAQKQEWFSKLGIPADRIGTPTQSTNK
jgi:hypothetical protein